MTLTICYQLFWSTITYSADFTKIHLMHCRHYEFILLTERTRDKAALKTATDQLQ